VDVRVDSARIRELRLGRAWSQELLAEKAGLNLRTIQRLESGGMASLKSVRAVAAGLGVGPDEIGATNPESAREPDAGGSHVSRSAALFVAVYALGTAITFGLTVLDQVYAFLLRTGSTAGSADYVFSEVADFLLQAAFLVALLAFAALVAAWNHVRTRVMIAASLTVGTALPIAVVVAINLISPGAWAGFEGSAWGPVVRFVLAAATVLLAGGAWFALPRGSDRQSGTYAINMLR